MNNKVALIWPTFMSYHVARFKALSQKLGDRVIGIELFSIQGRNDCVGRWRDLNRQGLPIITMFTNLGQREVNFFQLIAAVIEKLREHNVGTIFVTGYSPIEFLVIMVWAKSHGKKCFTFSESKYNDSKRFFLKEWFKGMMIRGFDGAVCAGRPHKEYLIGLGMDESKIFMGMDVVDNDFFKEQSSLSRKDKDELRLKYKLPEHYFIFVGRFVEKKNLSRLLSAYGFYRNRCMDHAPWPLFLCGAGPLEGRLKDQVKEHGIEGVHFVEPKDQKELAMYYGLASCFILPSTEEQWGLVVNEAMACGLPVLVSNIAGSAYELVEDNVNGFKLSPYDIEGIAGLMQKIHYMPGEKLEEMGRKSQEKVAFYSPEYFAENVCKAIQNEQGI